jgi:glycerophosphoryl diester phosphodiesterase
MLIKRFLALLLPLLYLSLAACTANPSTPENAPVNNPEYPKPLNIAHRGARSLAPENTLAAARKGFETGADMWELDVAVTADGELVILHDDTLERTSNAQQVYPDRRPWAVHTFTLAELRKLDFGSWFNQQDPFKQIAAGAVTPEMQQSYAGEPIPTLREALEFTRDAHWRVNIEIKDATGTPGDVDVVEKVVALVGELGMQEQVIISSFNHAYLRRVKTANAALATAALVEHGDPDPAALVRDLGAQGYNPRFKDIPPKSIPALREAGVDVYVWTVNDPDDMRALIQYGATGIISDFPQLVKEILQENAGN